MLELQRFVTEVLESIGGIVEPIEYALVEAIVPENYEYIFNGKSSTLLSFDYEVQQENVESEFVTFGSSILNSIIELANKNALYTEKYVIVDNLKIANPELKIQNYLKESNHNKIDVVINSVDYNIFLWIEFNFSVEFISDTTINEDIGIYINLNNLKRCNLIEKNKNIIFYEEKPIYNYPFYVKPNIQESLKIAYMEAKIDSLQVSKKYFDEKEFKKEKIRINTYYDELESENLKRISRKGITDDKIKEIKMKNESLKIEREKQLNEMENKYNVKPSIRIMNSIIYHIPVIVFDTSVKTRTSKENLKFIYNPIFKNFEIL